MRLHHSNIQIDRVRFWNVALILSCRGHAELVIRIPLQIFHDRLNSSHSARVCFALSHSFGDRNSPDSLLYLQEKKVYPIHSKAFRSATRYSRRSGELFRTTRYAGLTTKRLRILSLDGNEKIRNHSIVDPIFT